MDMYQKRKKRQEMKNNENKEKIQSQMNINWYPGHMAKTKRQIIEDLKLVDLVVEVLDARIPISSQNPDIQEYIKNKNKKGIREVIKKIHTVSAETKEKSAQKGRAGRSIRVLVLGIPNVGKSSFINRISKKTSAKVGNKPGVTRQKQWIRVDEGIELMDTPGVLWPKLGSEEVATNLAFTGTIKDDILEKTEIAFSLLKYLVKNYKQNLSERYKLDNKIDEIMNQSDDIDENDKYLEIFELIGTKRGAIISGGRVDYEKVSGILLDEFRSGKLGKITLEKVKI